MDSGGNQPADRSWWRRWGWTIPVGFVFVVGALLLIDVVWDAAGDDRARRMDAAQKTFTIIVGLGGVVTLAVLIHRQVVAAAEHKRQLEDQAHRIADAERRFEQAERVAADNLTHARNVAAATQHDAIQKRAQELFVKAVDQLGHDKAAVRVGALHALDDLGQEHPKRRRAVMDVWCAYLRMPPPVETKQNSNAATPDTEPAVAVWPAEELQVRATAQRLIAEHLRNEREPDSAEPEPERFWHAMDIDLSGAHLHDINLDHCHFRDAEFGRAQFAGDAWFDRARFTGIAGFGGTRFAEGAWFGEARFAKDAEFGRAQFAGDARFGEARFAATAWFGEARFAATAWFGDATFAEIAGFDGARFTGTAEFDGATFADDTGFSKATFAETARFDRVTFAGTTSFDGTTFAADASHGKAKFTRPKLSFDGARVLTLDRGHVWPEGWRVGDADGKPGRPLERGPVAAAQIVGQPDGSEAG